jgi:hypothetical protein
MATKETVSQAMQLMANVWRFPGTDLAAAAEAYYLALRNLSDQQVAEAVESLLATWNRTSPPKPADLIATARDQMKLAESVTPVRALAPRADMSHDELIHKLRCDVYHVDAWVEAVNEYAGTSYGTMFDIPRRYNAPSLQDGSMPIDLSRLISKKQAEYRRRLGIPEPTAPEQPRGP